MQRCSEPKTHPDLRVSDKDCGPVFPSLKIWLRSLPVSHQVRPKDHLSERRAKQVLVLLSVLWRMPTAFRTRAQHLHGVLVSYHLLQTWSSDRGWGTPKTLEIPSLTSKQRRKAPGITGNSRRIKCLGEWNQPQVQAEEEKEEARSTQPGLPGPGHGEEAGRQVQAGGEGTGEGRKGVQVPGPSAGRLPAPDTYWGQAYCLPFQGAHANENEMNSLCLIIWTDALEPYNQILKFITSIPVSVKKADWSMLNPSTICQRDFPPSLTPGLLVKLPEELVVILSYPAIHFPFIETLLYMRLWAYTDTNPHLFCDLKSAEYFHLHYLTQPFKVEGMCIIYSQCIFRSGDLKRLNYSGP